MASSRRASTEGDVAMPAQLTPAMRIAANAVQPPITINDTPYVDQVYAAIYAAARQEQGIDEKTREPA